ncbi:MAG TPA: N-6 DNA methylase [Ferruginibacter sp.]|nr:N-6 DNA methylase [Ferruginibacter sp.]HRE62434.1 N-6 DNA methylase [Ferruginibacter sp.]
MISKDEAHKKIASLIERFDEQKEFYKRSDYNETLTRRDFIDPFFKALGWDIDNEQGYAESYREVIHEDKIKIGGATKAPDYSFRLGGGKRLFFVEAKKPSVLIKDEITPAYQVRRYGWSAKLPISIITDFEEFAIYDCTKKPNLTDKASNGRIKYLTYQQYLNEFDFIWDTFSKEKVLKGSFDKFVQSDKQKKGTSTVDHEFLTSLDTWRTYLANNIALRNDIEEDELNFVVQHIIDRLIFLRIAEDRSVERYGNMQDTIKNGNYYENLLKQFHTADQKYNSGLFDFSKDKVSGRIEIDNKIIKTIISDLYYPLSPYEFSVISVEILGSAYEQFLGKTISLSKSGRALIEEKPEVRKAGGVYYTPQYIVDYIVKTTVGKLIDGKAPKDINKIKIVDPACGSGSFLIGAYQYLLQFHKDYYTNNGKPSKGSKDNPLTPDGNLTTAEKKRILLNNIFGVDLDANAVEVTKLSLLLKCMEGETEASISSQLKLFHERVLPTLDNNIKDGNSLIDIDFYGSEIDFGEEKKIKPFNWKKAFPEVFNLKKLSANQELRYHLQKVKKLQEETEDLINKFKVEEPSVEYGKVGGFDIVIGNPPYGASFSKAELDYYKNRYNTAVWRCESYLLFIEQALQLLKPDGAIGLIIPDTLLNLGFTQPTRELLLRNSKIEEIISLPSNVFAGATVDTIILLAEKKDYNSRFHISNVSVKAFGKKQLISEIKDPSKQFFVNTKEWFEQNAFNLQADTSEKKLLFKIEENKKHISDVAEMYSGIKAYEVGKGMPLQTERIREEKPYTAGSKIDKSWLPFYDGKHIGRYEMRWRNNNWIKYGKWLAAPRKPENFEGEKILVRKITGRTLLATYIPETSYCNTLLFVLKLNSSTYFYKSILAILNSQLIGWYFRTKFQISDDDTFPQIMIRDILQFPIPTINKKIDAELNKLVDQLLHLNAEKQQTTLQTKLYQLQNRIDYVEQRINEIVYELYGLAKEEIVLIENA